mgnify:CR=1 FL=1
MGGFDGIKSAGKARGFDGEDDTESSSDADVSYEEQSDV